MSVFPSDIDSDVEIQRVDSNITEIGGDVINALRDAVFAIEKTLGVNPQGNVQDLVTRINQVIDQNGNIKTSALAAQGLITLPITNAQIGVTAGIVETKLSLDYPTATLNALIASNTTDVDSVRSGLTGSVIQNVRHFTGIADRHDGYNIDLLATVLDGTNVETALHNLDNALSLHENLSSGSHAASSVSVSNAFVNISATNVQSALAELDQIGVGEVQSHQDRLHESATMLSNRGEQGAQGNLKETTLAGTIYQADHTKATDIFQVMRPNAARVTSENYDLGLLSNSAAKNLRIQAGGMGRGALDVSLSAIIPADDIDQIIDTINVSARTSHYPISAYNTFGKLTIAHNLPGSEFTIQILDTVSFSAASALGFGNVISTTFTWSGTEHAAFIGGERVIDINAIVRKSHIHLATSDTIALGLGDLALLGLTTGSEGRILCHITNHSTTPDDNGTYYILSYPTNATFILSETITAGSFDIEIAEDSVSFTNSARGELFDIFVEAYTDGYGKVTKSNRVSYLPISGITLRSVSESFPTTDVSWKVDSSESIQIFKGSDAGVITTISTGFQGQIKVFAPDNINSALFEVTGAPPNGHKSMTVSAFAGTSDRLHVGSVHYSGNYGLTILKFATDRRKLGGSLDNKTEDKLSPLPMEEATKELRNNGVIRGFDVMSFGASSFKLRGGRALVDGRIVDVETKTFTVNDFSAAKRFVLLDRNGNIVIKSEFEPGYSFEELTYGDAYGDNRGVAIICEFETDGSSIDGYFVDRRLMVNKIDKRLVDAEASLNQQITELRSSSQGSRWGFTVVNASPLDGYLGSIDIGANNGLTYIPSQYETEYSAHGFLAGSAIITTRKFEFNGDTTFAESVFRAPGLTHINVFIEATYTGDSGGPFGVSGTTQIELGVAVSTGMTSVDTSDDFAVVKTIYSGVLPVGSLTERYIVSVPVARLGLPENIMFDVTPRVRIINSNYVDGGISSDKEPAIEFDHIRIVTSSYSIAGDISGTDGSSSSIAVTVGDIL